MSLLLIYTQKKKETLQRKEKNYGLLLVFSSEIFYKVSISISKTANIDVVLTFIVVEFSFNVDESMFIDVVLTLLYRFAPFISLRKNVLLMKKLPTARIMTRNVTMNAQTLVTREVIVTSKGWGISRSPENL